ncbi:CcoQ/FixQ family Cbb3-type cytochrome c oxidase assembly chaperone [Niveispirillum sp. SYP-B3756]|uniref:cbb3-type cytochrome oxidase subunit 3 n=1 Tax=Niveispirillum sp. SYP-B3756 TaxID=2662178 RepID=UPI0012919602|nr:cbb3-type cytochrome c oxidase subunit 3 [Niveispirillum sp. SYP-B3756]MQP68630.1 CcoQ/FixQ family Cbb3-type cytochrome c oxidase assembly chaperone [Niveispirillum sp. SYP-B3756]
MPETGHALTLLFAKGFGLFYLLALSVGTLIYAFWPGSGKRFDHAAKSVLRGEDQP